MLSHDFPTPPTASLDSPFPRHAVLGAALGAGWFGLVLALVRWAAPGVPVPSTLGILGTTLLLLIAVSPLEYYGSAFGLQSVWSVIGVLVTGGIGWLANVALTRAGLSGPASLGLLVGAVAVGVLLGRFALIDRDLLLLVAALYIIIDIYSVFFGPTQAILQQGGPLLSMLTVRFPLLGTARVIPLVGATDFLVWAACLQAAYRFGFPYRPSFAALAGGLLLSGIVSVVFARAVPALPLMMIAYLWVNRRAFDWRNRTLWTLGAGLLVVVLLVGVVARRFLLR